MLRRRALFLIAPMAFGAAGLGGCAELRQPNIAWPLPPGLLPPEQEAGRAAVAALAAGQGLVAAPPRADLGGIPRALVVKKEFGAGPPPA